MKVANRKAANRKVANSLLAALPGKNYQRLLSGLEPVTLNFGDVLYETGQKMQPCLLSRQLTRFPADGGERPYGPGSRHGWP